MKFKIGTFTDEATGDVRDRYLIMGRVIKDAELRSVGSKNTSMLKFTVSPGKGDDLCNFTMWGYDADDYRGICKGTIVFADVLEKVRIYNGKQYRDYEPMNIMVTGLKEIKENNGFTSSRNVTDDAIGAFSEIDGSIFG